MQTSVVSDLWSCQHWSTLIELHMVDIEQQCCVDNNTDVVNCVAGKILSNFEWTRIGSRCYTVLCCPRTDTFINHFWHLSGRYTAGSHLIIGLTKGNYPITKVTLNLHSYIIVYFKYRDTHFSKSHENCKFWKMCNT